MKFQKVVKVIYAVLKKNKNKSVDISNFKICIFHLILPDILSSLIVFVEDRAGFDKLILSDVR